MFWRDTIAGRSIGADCRDDGGPAQRKRGSAPGRGDSLFSRCLRPANASPRGVPEKNTEYILSHLLRYNEK